MSDEKSPAQLARDAAIEQSVATLAYIAVTVAVSVAILKRDYLTRLWMRVHARRPSPAKVRESALLAELRRDMSAVEHGGGPAARPRGLYEV